MSENRFELEVHDLHWLNFQDDPRDLCAHGRVFVKIGDEILDHADDITVSSTALYLMRTLTRDYKKGEFHSQLLPCCGFTFFKDEKEDTVSIMGCGVGVDWSITHTNGNLIKHLSEKGSECIISHENYKSLVLDFADKVERFYQSSLEKSIPLDDVQREGYEAFWKEWRRLRKH